MVNEVRIGLYPQLEKPWFSVDTAAGGQYSQAEGKIEMDAVMEVEEMPAPAPVSAQRGKYDSSLSSIGNSRYQQKSQPKRMPKKKNMAIKAVDPKANIQTGPGLPSWNWNNVELTWSGPVEKGESLDLILVSPMVNMLLNFLRVFLVLILAWRLLSQVSKGFTNSLKRMKKTKAATANVAIAILSVPLLAVSIDDAHAQKVELQNAPQQNIGIQEIAIQENLPSENLLSELKQRLLAPADCLPDCAQIERLSLQLDNDVLQGRMRVHAAEKTAIPLPGNAKILLPDNVLLDGVIANSLSRNNKGELWLVLEAGSHDIVINGRLPKTAQIQLVLPLLPHKVDWSSDAWSVDGIDNGVPTSPLQINRVLSQQPNNESVDVEQGNTLLPAFLSVERTLHLGLDWTVDTVVRRLSPRGNPIVMSIPLLDGESVLSENMTVKNNMLRVSLAANQSTMHWQSRLAIKDKFTLKASDISGFIETWKVETSPIWHLESKGIPVVHHQQDGGVWLPTWKPWAGETVSFDVSRPKGVDGQTLTISSSSLNINMGKRSNDVNLAFSLRSSQGAQHTVNLPEHAELRSVSINGKKQAVRQNGTKVTLPVSPSQQTIELEWREPHSNGLLFSVSPVDLGVANVNSQIHLAVPQDRWVLWAGGLQLGPAVLFWGVLIVILLGSIILAKSKLAPVKTWQ